MHSPWAKKYFYRGHPITGTSCVATVSTLEMMSTVNLEDSLINLFSEYVITNPIIQNDGITGRALDMITMGNGCYLQSGAGVYRLEAAGL